MLDRSLLTHLPPLPPFLTAYLSPAYAVALLRPGKVTDKQFAIWRRTRLVSWRFSAHPQQQPQRRDQVGMRTFACPPRSLPEVFRRPDP